MEIGRLVTMANRIGDFFTPYPEAEAVEGVRDHLARFWDPRMRAQLVQHLATGGAGLVPTVAEAVRRLTPPS